MTNDDDRVEVAEEMRSLLLGCAGFFAMIDGGYPVPNVREQAHDLLEKIGELLTRLDAGPR